MNIIILCVGKIKENFISDGIKEFSKRLQTYGKVSFVELKEESNEKNINLIVKKESEEILRNIHKIQGYNILLDIQGECLSSEELSAKINTLSVKGNSTLVFIIGGSYGVAEEVRKSANMKLSFSKFTFPHQLMRLILLEQIYRTFNILNNGKYHK
ncbi:23S rRNA (pseudouridine(1915)-N(3))-methyltransferase RlmH [Fusobacterium sp. PH5-44]|uniref:23S rRNA (pseudouridine(1915)-N(3))-methyltransferase RlmH n=1 Tax=unclassified Fusobacterium TaxID=2648384 RepID=UPI003D1D6FD0